MRANAERPGGGERKNAGQNGSEHVWFWGCCDASDVILPCRDGARKVVGVCGGSWPGVKGRCVSLNTLLSCGNE